MNTNSRINLLVIIVGLVIVFFVVKHEYAVRQGPMAEPRNTVDYVCDAGHKLVAAYFTEQSLPAAPGEPPVPGGTVILALDDGRGLTLIQTISADGARYSNADDSFVFWSKGSGALIQENGQSNVYQNCEATSTAVFAR